MQIDGNKSCVNSSKDDGLNDQESDMTDSICDTDDEVDPIVIPANLHPITGQNVAHDEPLHFDVNTPESNKSSFIPLCLMMNCRSICNKINNLSEMINPISPDLILASKTWERERLRIKDILKN